MRTILKLLTIQICALALSACAPTMSATPGLSATASPVFSSNADPTQPKRRGWLRSQLGSGSLIYVCTGSEVLLYPESGFNKQPVGTITDGVNGANGLFVDGKRDLFVANSTTITAYHSGSLHPYITYNDSASPLYVVKDHAGKVYAANRDGTVSVYLPGHTAADRTLQTPGIEADGINVDASSNLYVAYRDHTGDGSIEKFAPNSTTGSVLGMTLIQPQGLQLDHSGNIIVVETGIKQVVDVFPPGSKVPSKEVYVQDGVAQVVLRKAEDNMYISNWVYRDIYISPYPPSKFHIKIKVDNGVTGVALSNEER
jgi:hypothetical protein